MNTPSSSEAVGRRATPAIRSPRSLTEAQRLCELYAELDGQIAAIEEARDAAIAAANAVVDKDLAPLLVQRAAIVCKLAPWWGENAALLTQGKRKSAELGGCVLGTREGRASVIVTGDEKALAEKMMLSPWSKAFLRVTVALDKAALLKGLEGKRADALGILGVSRKVADPVFFIHRTAQGGTQAKVQR